MSVKPDGERLASIETDVKDMRLRLFGVDGETGWVGAQKEMHASNTARVERLETWVKLGLGVIITALILTGSGAVSLSSLLKFLKP
jgi:hypothetical protein